LVYGGIAWTYIIVITASGALGGSLGVLIVDKPRGGVLMAGIFGLIAALITLLYMINCL
jgi:hypothetical protein